MISSGETVFNCLGYHIDLCVLPKLLCSCPGLWMKQAKYLFYGLWDLKPTHGIIHVFPSYCYWVNVSVSYTWDAKIIMEKQATHCPVAECCTENLTNGQTTWCMFFFTILTFLKRTPVSISHWSKLIYHKATLIRDIPIFHHFHILPINTFLCLPGLYHFQFYLFIAQCLLTP